MTEELIRREAAIDACLNGWNKGYEEIVKEIRALPTEFSRKKAIGCLSDMISMIIPISSVRNAEGLMMQKGAIADGAGCE